MPASPTRLCPTCNTHRLIAEFRDPGDTKMGRPPKHCRFCRAESTKLQQKHEANKARRERARHQQRGFAERAPLVRFSSTITTHPDGTKVCPPLSGCGRRLPLWCFRYDKYQADGLSSRCTSCYAGSQSTPPLEWLIEQLDLAARMPVPLRQLVPVHLAYAAR